MKNTFVQVWLEIWPSSRIYDWPLDCGDNTFEEAIVKLAALGKDIMSSAVILVLYLLLFTEKSKIVDITKLQ